MISKPLNHTENSPGGLPYNLISIILTAPVKVPYNTATEGEKKRKTVIITSFLPAMIVVACRLTLFLSVYSP